MTSRGGTDPRAENFAAVLAAAQAGAEWACTTLWVEHSPAVTAFLRVRGSREPEDLASDTFMAVFERLPQFVGGEAEFRSFLFSVGYRRLVDELRKRSRRGEHVEFSEDADGRSSPSAEDEAIERVSEQSALTLIDSLPPDQRSVLALRIIADLTVDQIAEVLGKRPGAVKALQRRALERLRKRIGKTRTPDGDSDDGRK